MAEIEPYIVELAIKLAEMRVPITSKQGLQLANSLIKGSAFQESVLLWKQNNCSAFRERGTQELGPGYWNGFLKRNKHLIRAKKAVKFDSKRAEWCTYSNIDEMYTEIYESMVEAGIAVKHNEKVWRSANGDICR
jgi:hypothetical protein